MLGELTWRGRLITLFSVACFAGAFLSARAQIPTYSNEVHINEFLPDPVGDDDTLEFIELHNNSNNSIDLSGWVLKNASGKVLIISSGVHIDADGYMAFYSSQTGSMLANTGERSISLIDPGATIHETASYNGSTSGYSYNRLDDGTYSKSSTPTPNALNILDPTPTPSPTPTTIPSPSTSPSSSPVVEYSEHAHINEFIPNPAGDDATLEFIELYNDSADAVDISGWKLDDIADGGSPPFIIPDDTSIPTKGYIVFYSSQTKLSLNNDSEHVRLISSDDIVREDITYVSSKEGYSYNHVDDGDFQQSERPTPGEENIIEVPNPTTTSTPKPLATPKPTTTSTTYDFSSKIVINELYPNTIKDDKNNEFIEIKNLDNRVVSLVGWTVDDEDGGSKPYRFKFGDKIGPTKIIVLDKNSTKIALNNSDDSARLIDPQGKVVAILAYEKTYAGQSLSRTDDGLYQWTDIVTPGKENIICVHEEVLPTPKQVRGKKVPASQPRVAGAVTMVSQPTPPPDWPGLVSHNVVRTVYGNSNIPNPNKQKQVVFMAFGILCAGWQLISGISRKEKIWFN
ncbi:MAG: lamin tail domain-containing protein [Candidatus Andersenbacteria bacterium]|nr:lamin tail domain-containing protein [Candidatus Andersenbacteria bacterium]